DPLGIHAVQAARAAEARAAYEHVDLGAELGYARGELLARGGIAEVRGKRLRTHAVGRAQFVGEGAQPLGAARDEDEVEAAFRQQARDLRADPGRGTGDERSAVWTWRREMHAR